jgi:hypothetical protein
VQGNEDLETLQGPPTEWTDTDNDMPSSTGSGPGKHVLDTLNRCLCGEVVDSLKLPSNAIIKCKELGCETEWVIDLFLVIFVAYITHLII